MALAEGLPFQQTVHVLDNTVLPVQVLLYLIF